MRGCWQKVQTRISKMRCLCMCVCVRLAFGDLQAAFYWLVFFLLKETYYTNFRLHMSQLCMIHSLKSHYWCYIWASASVWNRGFELECCAQDSHIRKHAPNDIIQGQEQKKRTVRNIFWVWSRYPKAVIVKRMAAPYHTVHVNIGINF